MITIPAKCYEKRNDTIISLGEKGKKIVFLNPENTLVEIITVDEHAIKEGIRCDRLLITENKVEHYIEFKGSDIIKAFQQISRSIDKLTENKKNPKFCYIICSRVSGIPVTNLQSNKILLKNSFNCMTTIKEKYLEVRI